MPSINYLEPIAGVGPFHSGGSSQNTTANTKIVEKIILAAPTSIDGVITRVNWFSTNTSMRPVLYTDSGGSPSSLIAAGPGQSFTSYTVNGPIFLYFGSRINLSAGTYWIGLQTNAATPLMYESVAAGHVWYYNSDTYSDGAASSFGTPTAGTDTIQYDLRAGTLKELYYDAGFLQWLSTTGSIGQIGGGNYGCLYCTPTQITVPCKATHLVALLNRYTAGASYQFCLYAHDSVNGKPGALLGQTATIDTVIETGYHIGALVAPVDLVLGGTYWIGVHSNDAVGFVCGQNNIGGSVDKYLSLYPDTLYAGGPPNPFSAVGGSVLQTGSAANNAVMGILDLSGVARNIASWTPTGLTTDEFGGITESATSSTHGVATTTSDVDTSARLDMSFNIEVNDPTKAYVKVTIGNEWGFVNLATGALGDHSANFVLHGVS